MSANPVIGYVFGIGIFMVAGWFLNGIKNTFVSMAIHQNTAVFTLFQYVWTASFIIFLIGGGIYVIRQYSERSYAGGFGR